MMFLSYYIDLYSPYIQREIYRKEDQIGDRTSVDAMMKVSCVESLWTPRWRSQNQNIDKTILYSPYIQREIYRKEDQIGDRTSVDAMMKVSCVESLWTPRWRSQNQNIDKTWFKRKVDGSWCVFCCPRALPPRSEVQTSASWVKKCAGSVTSTKSWSSWRCWSSGGFHKQMPVMVDQYLEEKQWSQTFTSTLSIRNSNCEIWRTVVGRTSSWE